MLAKKKRRYQIVFFFFFFLLLLENVYLRKFGTNLIENNRFVILYHFIDHY